MKMNGYNYANNNPVMYVDPDGHWVWLAVNAGFAIYDGYKSYKKTKSWKRALFSAATNFGPGKILKGGKKALGIAKAIGANSKRSKRINHGYEIYEKSRGKKKIVKVGISASRLNKNGTSARANRQVNKWNKQAGYQKYHARVVKKSLKGRQKALNWEQGRVTRIGKANSRLFPNQKHKRPLPQYWR
ncbi:hypothetical protein A7X98_03155 [Listeria monocytogenes]|nr:hypothetical protein [Listeria monocytogenes]ECB9797215.1 hypothetical protein [Listeria monocytogenes]